MLQVSSGQTEIAAATQAHRPYAARERTLNAGSLQSAANPGETSPARVETRLGANSGCGRSGAARYAVGI
jgi:hypothetical protein